MSSVAIGEAKQKQGGKGEVHVWLVYFWLNLPRLCKTLQDVDVYAYLQAVVVAVVGMGHVMGICKNFGQTTEQEFSRVGR